MVLPGRGRGVERGMRLLALTQGVSYVYFGVWALIWTRHYIRTHELSGQDRWVLRAHALWMITVGSTLLRATIVGRVTDETVMLAVGSAASLAANDAYSIRQIAPIYRIDLAYETGFLGSWLAFAARRIAKRTTT
jgi:hypothetical protein